MGYDNKLTDQQIKDKTTYQFVVEVVIKQVTTRPGVDGYYSDTVVELTQVTSKRDTLLTAVKHAQAVLDLEVPGSKPTCRTCRGPVATPGEQCETCRASR